jgi:plastocyanin
MKRVSRGRSRSLIAALEAAAFISIIGLMLAVPQLPSARAATWQVSIVGFAYQPAILEIAVGDTVAWTNNDGVAHTVTADDDSWDSGIIGAGGTYSRTFDSAGVYPYYCTLHPYMTGTLYVGVPIPEFSSAALVVIGMAALMLGTIVLTRRSRR